MRRNTKATAFIGVAIVIMLITRSVPTQSGGEFTIEKSVIANGGGASNGALTIAYYVEGTTAQNIAGTQSSAGQFSVDGGFWTPPFLAPTAATVRVGGRVERSSGVGIDNAVLILTGVSTASTRIARSSSFGYFNFDGVTVGEFYFLTVTHKNFTFFPDNYSFNLLEEPPEIIFRAE